MGAMDAVGAAAGKGAQHWVLKGRQRSLCIKNYTILCLNDKTLQMEPGIWSLATRDFNQLFGQPNKGVATK